ncbi:MAG: HAD family hydrolase, partial [Candidatus Chisholmbacteria bacterium]|nr:HAD family hydrolase [Candidatus Chisholmbacteria bacterium]
NKRQDIEEKLRLIGLDPNMFAVIVGTQDLGIHKPSPGPFEFVLKQLGANPKGMVFIGDKDNTDVDGASNIGMWTIKLGEPSVVAGATFRNRYEVIDFLVRAKEVANEGTRRKIGVG